MIIFHYNQIFEEHTQKQKILPDVIHYHTNHTQ